MKSGDTLITKWSAKVFPENILAPLIKLFLGDKHDALWGWHMIKVLWKEDGEWMIGESVASGTRVVPLSTYKGVSARLYRWLDEPPTKTGMKMFVGDVEGFKYDVFVYFLTFLYYAIKLISFGKIRIKRYKDNKLMCWEYCELFDTYFGKDWDDPYPNEDPYPLITEFVDCATFIEEMVI